MSSENEKAAPAKSKIGSLHGLNKAINATVFTPDAVAKSRMAICRSCEHLTSANFCRKCKCMMTLKTRLAMMKCPEGKWLKYTLGSGTKKDGSGA